MYKNNKLCSEFIKEITNLKPHKSKTRASAGSATTNNADPASSFILPV
jgi:hypothetical protein